MTEPREIRLPALSAQMEEAVLLSWRVAPGDHVEQGQPIAEVSTDKVDMDLEAPFSGTIDKILIEGGDGTIVSKGQPLFKITPDEKFVEVDPKAVEKEKRTCTAEYLKAVL